MPSSQGTIAFGGGRGHGGIGLDIWDNDRSVVVVGRGRHTRALAVSEEDEDGRRGQCSAEPRAPQPSPSSPASASRRESKVWSLTARPVHRPQLPPERFRVELGGRLQDGARPRARNRPAGEAELSGRSQPPERFFLVAGWP